MNEFPHAYSEMEGFQRWLLSHPAESLANSTSEVIFLRDIGRALRDQERRRDLDIEDRWAGAFTQLVTGSCDSCRDYLRADHISKEFGVDIAQLSSSVAEWCLSRGGGERLAVAFSQMADSSGIAVYRFLAAWIYFNRGALERCVEECDRCDRPYANILGLQGQALLEWGRPREAIRVLTSTLELAPQDLFARFQLAKAHLVLEEFEEAFQVSLSCHHLAPESAEIVLLMGMVVRRHAHATADQMDVSGRLLERLVRELPSHEEAVHCLLMIAARAKSRDRAREAINLLDGESLSKSPEFVSGLPPLLREFSSLGWMAESRQLLERVTPPFKGVGEDARPDLANSIPT